MTPSEFLSHKSLALMRLSAQSPVMGAKIDEELARKGYKIDLVYLNAGPSDPTIADVKDQVEGAIIAVPKSECAAAVKEALAAGIPRLWIQAGNQSQEALDLCAQSKVPVVSKACVMMYAAPVESVHGFHRKVWKLFGQLQE